MIGIYCRISGKKAQGKDISIEDQKEQGVKFAKEKNLEYKIYEDVGISGAKDEIEDRPRFAELFTDIEGEVISSVFVIDQSRIERNSRIWQLFSYAIVKYECNYFVGGKPLNLDDAETRLSTGIISLTNEFYTKITAKKVKSANRINAKKGKGHGITAYGYKKDDRGFLVIDSNKVNIIKDIYQWSLEGTGSYTIANKLNELNVPTKSHEFHDKFIERKDKYTKKVTKYSRSKVKWRGNVVYDMIINPIYKGERNYGDVTVQIEPIIDSELWDKVNKNLANNKKNVGPKNKFNYLLNGLVFCAACDSEYRGRCKTSGRNKTYSCKGRSRGLACGSKRGLNIPRLESFILQHLFYSKDLHKKLSNLKEDSDKLDLLQVELANLRSEEKLIDSSRIHFRRLISDPQLVDDFKPDYLKVTNEHEKIKIKIEQLVENINKVSQVHRKARLDKIFGEFDYQMNFDQIKKSVHALIDSIQVKHFPLEKCFVVQIKFKGYNESSVFSTDHNQMKWFNMSHYQITPITEDDRQDSDDLIEFLSDTNNWTREKIIESLQLLGFCEQEFEEWNYAQLLDKVKKLNYSDESVLNIETPNIVLDKVELYDFNKS